VAFRSPELLLFSFAFKSPWLLLVLVAVPVAVGLYLLLEQRRARRAARWSSPALLQNMVVGASGGLRWVPALIVVLATAGELVLCWFAFTSYWVLVLLVIPVAVSLYLLLEWRRNQDAASASTQAPPRETLVGSPGRLRHVPALIFALGMTLLLLGFARPERKVTQAKDGATVVFLIDDSGSMGANDVRPTRLAAADATVTAFVNKLPPQYRAALITFSTGIATKVPPTYDRPSLIRGLPRQPELQGTSLGTALQEALNVAQKAVGPSKPGAPHPPATILLLSDGGSNSGNVTPSAAAKLALKAAIPVSTIAIGTPGGQVHQNVPITGGNGKTVPVVQRAPVDPTTLKLIAGLSGGTFYAAPSVEALSRVYTQLGLRLVYGKQYHEITVWVAAAALVLVLAAAALSSWWFRRLV
jgi:Ca-activated chloride channel family protein